MQLITEICGRSVNFVPLYLAAILEFPYFYDVKGKSWLCIAVYTIHKSHYLCIFIWKRIPA